MIIHLGTLGFPHCSRKIESISRVHTCIGIVLVHRVQNHTSYNQSSQCPKADNIMSSIPQKVSTGAPHDGPPQSRVFFGPFSSDASQGRVAVIPAGVRGHGPLAGQSLGWTIGVRDFPTTALRRLAFLSRSTAQMSTVCSISLLIHCIWDKTDVPPGIERRST
jgi:hypothetical protein